MTNNAFLKCACAIPSWPRLGSVLGAAALNMRSHTPTASVLPQNLLHSTPYPLHNRSNQLARDVIRRHDHNMIPPALPRTPLAMIHQHTKVSHRRPLHPLRNLQTRIKRLLRLPILHKLDPPKQAPPSDVPILEAHSAIGRGKVRLNIDDGEGKREARDGCALATECPRWWRA
ncbi:hypothetical protein BT67DRAFT_121888 [Trichocladium antarcticum]|uniref:Uncharacterized protein n=1 Tax=Trichocladium antarcticum TaxID=1450529 RepID=A0AAN6URC8_9PEZI|nr:hypothetical protein BT67DRAFT_121888 [Trichocladium antarcticum]